MQRRSTRDRVQAFHDEEEALPQKEISLLKCGCLCGTIVGGLTVAVIGIIVIRWIISD